MKIILASAAVIMIGATGAHASPITLGAKCSNGDVVPNDCAIDVFDPTGSFVASVESKPTNRVQIFNTDLDDTKDSDLEVDQGNILIVSQKSPPEADPNDSAGGGSITLNFKSGFRVGQLASFLWVDDEAPANWDIIFDFADTNIADFTLPVTPATGDIDDLKPGEEGFASFDFADKYTAGFEAGFELLSLTVNQNGDSGGWAVSVVPVPASVLMLAAGMGLFGAARRMKARGIA